MQESKYAFYFFFNFPKACTESKIQYQYDKLSKFVTSANGMIASALEISETSTVVAQSILNVCIFFFFLIFSPFYITGSSAIDLK